VAHCVVSYIILHAQVMNAVNCDSSVESMMDGVVAHVRRMHSTDHVEMDGIATENESLTHSRELNTIDSSRGSLIAR